MSSFVRLLRVSSYEYSLRRLRRKPSAQQALRTPSPAYCTIVHRPCWTLTTQRRVKAMDAMLDWKTHTSTSIDLWINDDQWPAGCLTFLRTHQHQLEGIALERVIGWQIRTRFWFTDSPNAPSCGEWVVGHRSLETAGCKSSTRHRRGRCRTPYGLSKPVSASCIRKGRRVLWSWSNCDNLAQAPIISLNYARNRVKLIYL